MLTLKADDQFASIYEKDQLIAQHPRSFQKYQRIEDPSHFGYHACQHGIKTLFTTAMNLINQLSASLADHSFLKAMKLF